jgi:hypothetical protein
MGSRSCFDCEPPTGLELRTVVSKYANKSRETPTIWPSPPTRAPIPNAPFLPNSTATKPNGSSRDGINANSAPEKINGGRAVNSGLEKTLPGYFFMRTSSFNAANLPYRSMTGPTQINWTLGFSSRRAGMASAMRSIPTKVIRARFRNGKNRQKYGGGL